MKTLSFLFILLSAAYCTFCAQEARKPDRIDTLTVNGNTYYYHPNPTRKIYSSRNKIKIKKACDDFYVDKETSGVINGVVKKVFSKKRIQELAENNYSISVKMYCNIKGKILEIDFLLHDSEISYKGDRNSLSINEIDLLDKEAKKYKFDLRRTCTDVKYYVVWWRMRLNRHIDDL